GGGGLGGGGVGVGEGGGEVGAGRGLDLTPDAVPLVEDRGAPPALDRVQAGDPGGQLNHDEPDQLARESVVEGGEAGEVRVGTEIDGLVGRQDVPHPLGDVDVGEERVDSLAGGCLDAVGQAQALPHRRVGRRDDRAGGGAAG